MLAPSAYRLVWVAAYATQPPQRAVLGLPEITPRLTLPKRLITFGRSSMQDEVTYYTAVVKER